MNIYLLIPDLLTRSPIVIATVIETKGSTPQKQGSSALFDASGLISGTVGGGVLEGKVQQIALETLKTGKSGVYQFYLDKDISFKNDAICGGEATVLIDASAREMKTVFKQIKNSIRDGIPGVLMTFVTGVGEADQKIRRFWLKSDDIIDHPDQFTLKKGSGIRKLVPPQDKHLFEKIGIAVPQENNFLILYEPVSPPSRLIIAGAGHIGKALSHIGRLLGFDVTVIDDRIEYANANNIPDADHIIVEDIGKALIEQKRDSDTYVVIVTRGHNDDAKALRHCINSGAAYVGMIGSKTKIAQMHRNFVENGWATEEQWSEIHAPVGLEILSQTVEEIAVSIAAELVLVRNRQRKK
jgi:xanthine dehydrogenase accessory factor